MKSTNCQTDSNIFDCNSDFVHIENLPRHFKPYHIRLQEYQKIRARIFNEELYENVKTRKTKRNTRRLRGFWKRVRASRKLFCSSVISNTNTDDIRPFTTVTIF